MHECAVPPGQPRELTVTDIQTTFALIQWSPPSDNFPISYYLIYATHSGQTSPGMAVLEFEVDIAATSYNVTGLLPGTTYELTVVAVSQGGNIIAEGQPSSPIVNTTGVTGMSINCKGY